jgi:DNA-binding NtrC family response regulator
MTFAKTQPPVLLAEDNEALLDMFSAMFRKHGLEIETADSYSAARTFLERFAISGLITDEDLGDGKGTTLAELALQKNPHARIGIVSGDQPDLSPALVGRVTLLAKPFSSEELHRFLAHFPRAVRPA